MLFLSSELVKLNIYLIAVFISFFSIFSCIILAIVNKHKKFIKNAKRIREGMSMNQVMFIITEPPTAKQTVDNKVILLWEKPQWKGIQNGGTLIRSIQIEFVDNKVTSIFTKNLNVSCFW